ncbi:MAG: ATP synthase F1 subunit gamma [Acidobacteriota bacterium]|nr:ATP synthase F1 subunit gamma [Acidobacteriota bacterium]
MANLIDIRRRIRSVKNTQQITKAVKMVAASKLRRSQDRAIATRPYASTLEATLRAVVARVAPREDGAPLHPLLATRVEKNVVLVVVSGDKGLAGGFNTNVNRAAAAFLREAPERGFARVAFVALGKKANDFWRRRPVEILKAQAGLAAIGAASAGEIARALAAQFVSGETDAVYVISNEFKSAISQVVSTKKLLPIALENSANAAGGADYLYEPSPEEILGTLLPRFLEFQMYRAILESQAAFFAAQMTAMDSATKNAGDMIDSLTLTYNRARQARITKELIEIVSGAAALE